MIGKGKEDMVKMLRAAALEVAENAEEIVSSFAPKIEAKVIIRFGCDDERIIWPEIQVEQRFACISAFNVYKQQCDMRAKLRRMDEEAKKRAEVTP